MTVRVDRFAAASAVVAAATLLSACAGTPEQETARTWNAAGRYVPAGQNPPVVIFLHGCGGFTPGNSVWGQTLQRAGFLVIMPNSFARWARAKNCDGSAFSGGWDYRVIPEIRIPEVKYALEQVKAMRPVPPKVFLMGHSEGGLTTLRWYGGGFDGYVALAASCNMVNLPDDAPTLIVRHETDAWYPNSGPGACQEAARIRSETKAYVVPGHGHDVHDVPAVQKEVVDFLKRLAALPATR